MILELKEEIKEVLKKYLVKGLSNEDAGTAVIHAGAEALQEDKKIVD